MDFSSDSALGIVSFATLFFQEVSRFINSPESKVKVIFFYYSTYCSFFARLLYYLSVNFIHIFDLFPGITEPNLAKHDVKFQNVLQWVFNVFILKEDTKSVKKDQTFF